MKTINFSLILYLLCATAFGQDHKKEITHYIFPEFVKGTVLMKAGGKNVVMLNYNALTEEMIFDTNGKKLAIGPLEQVDTIYISGRKFFPVGKTFVELLHKGKYELYARHRSSIVDPGKPAAYGGTTQTSAVTSYSSYVSGGQVYELTLPEGVQTKAYTDFWLKKEGRLAEVVSLRQLSKQFPEKADQFKKFVKEHKVDYDIQANILDLISYMEGL